MAFRFIPTKAGIAARMNTDEHSEPNHQDLIRRLEGLAMTAMTATARDENGTAATLLTWHRRLGHPSFKTVVALARNGASGMVITDIPERIPGLDACAACIAAKSVRLPHKKGRERAKEYLGRIHIDIAGPMPIKSAGGREYVFVVVDDHSRGSTLGHCASNQRRSMPSRCTRQQQKMSHRKSCARS